MKKYLISIIIGLLLVGTLTFGAQGNPPLFWKVSGDSLSPLISTWELGSSAARIAKGWFAIADIETMDVGTTTISGVVSGTSSFTGDAEFQADVNIGGNVLFNAEYNNGTSSASTTINWNNGQKQKLEIEAPTTGITFSGGGVGNFLLRIVQGTSATGTIEYYNALWPGGTSPTHTTATGSVDIVSCYYNTSSYYCTDSLDLK